MAATSGVAALVPTTAPQPPCVDEYSAMPPSSLPPPDGVNSAAAEMSLVARFAQEPKADAFVARNAVWNAGVANSVLQPLVVAPDESSHTRRARRATTPDSPGSPRHRHLRRPRPSPE
jgi:hypothetical protein